MTKQNAVLNILGRYRPWKIPLGGLIIFSIFSAAEFRKIDENLVKNWRALQAWSQSPTKFIPAVRRRYGLFIDLRETSPQAILVRSSKEPRKSRIRSPDFRMRLYGTGEVSRIEQESFDPRGVKWKGVYESYITASGKTENHSYSIYVLDRNQTRLYFLTPSEHELHFVDQRLLTLTPPLSTEPKTAGD